MRRVLLVILSLVWMVAAALPAAAAEGRVIYLPVGKAVAEVDGVETALDVPANIVGGRTLVPLRFVSESLGATVGWDGAERKVSIGLGSRSVEIWIDKVEARVNGQNRTLDVPPIIQNDRTMVPIRFVTENLGLAVGWDNQNRAVYVVSGQPANVVFIRDFAFGSGQAQGKAGGPLVFINLDEAEHTVTAKDMRFDSGELKLGWAYTLKLERAGTYPIFCDYHPTMTATVVIE